MRRGTVTGSTALAFAATEAGTRRENRAPAYVQEFIRILAKWPLYAEFSSRTRGRRNSSLGKSAAA